MQIGDKIQELRKRQKLSQEQFAEILNVSRQTISRWESNINFPEHEKILEIAKFFDVKVSYLLDLEADLNDEKNVDLTEVISSLNYKYHESVKKTKKLTRGLITSFILILLFSATYYNNQKSLERELSFLRHTISSLESKVRSINTNNNNNVVNPNSLFSESFVTISDISPADNIIEFTIGFVLKEFVNDTEVAVEIKAGDETKVYKTTLENGSVNKLVIKEKIQDDIKISAIIKNKDVNKVELLNTFYGLKKSLSPIVEFTPISYISQAHTSQDMNEFNEKGIYPSPTYTFAMSIFPSEVTNDIVISLSKINVHVYINDKYYDDLPFTDFEDFDDQEPVSNGISGTLLFPKLSSFSMKKGDSLKLVSVVIDNYGQIHKKELVTYTLDVNNSTIILNEVTI